MKDKNRIRKSNNCCAFCGHESKANHPIDKGYYEPKEEIKNSWTKKYRLYICTFCLIEHNPHRCTNKTNKIYISHINKGDKANMVRCLHGKQVVQKINLKPK